jgi:small subunit ribosomal protein S1
MTNERQAVLETMVANQADMDSLMDGSGIHPMASLLEQYEGQVAEPHPGEIRQGIVVDKRSNEILIDIGFKSEGIVSGREIERLGDAYQVLEIGSEVPVFVLREDRDGNVLLSIARAQAEQDWQRAETFFQSQEIFDGVVSAYNRGGVIVRSGSCGVLCRPASSATKARPCSTWM